MLPYCLCSLYKSENGDKSLYFCPRSSQVPLFRYCYWIPACGGECALEIGGEWSVESYEKDRDVRCAHEKTRIFGAHKCHPVVFLYGISFLPDPRPQTPDPALRLALSLHLMLL